MYIQSSKKSRPMKIKHVLAISISGLLLSGLFAFKMLNSSWTISSKDAKISFTMPNGKHGGTVSGFDATIDFDAAHPELAAIKASVDVSSIETGEAKLNGHLMTTDFFDAEHHPKIYFTAEKITKNETGFLATGKLIMRDSTHIINIPFTFEQKEKQAWMKGTMDIFAGDYGIGKKSEKGSDRVVVTIEIPLTKE